MTMPRKLDGTFPYQPALVQTAPSKNLTRNFGASLRQSISVRECALHSTPQMAQSRPAKRRRLGPSLREGPVPGTISATDLFYHAADWDLEQDYEQRTRRKEKKESTRLPIKTAGGIIERVQEDIGTGESEESTWSASEAQEKRDTSPTHVPEGHLKSLPNEDILSVKEELARLASLLNEDPETHPEAFKKLAQFGDARHGHNVRKLAFATQVAVYNDAIPGYRIRKYQDMDLGSKVSKDVRRVRQYESSLLSGYQHFVGQLTLVARNKPLNLDDTSLRSVAINCACTLLLAVPHFNFRRDLLMILIHELASSVLNPDFAKCVDTITTFFDADDDGSPSFEAVSMLAKMFKARDYRIREEVLNTFFHLRLLSDLSRNNTSPDSGNSKQSTKLHGRRVKKEKWQHQSKKERKLARERKAVEKDMKAADAIVNSEEREKLQSETLKLVFATYFRILKARKQHLIGAVLEGLAKYALLINQDLFGDLLEMLKDIITRAVRISEENDFEEYANSKQEGSSDMHNHTREALLAIQTAFTLLSGQDVSKSAASLHLDLQFFSAHTFRSLYPLALDAEVELGSKSLSLSEPESSPALDNTSNIDGKSHINISTPALLLIRILTSILLTPSQPPPTSVVASFFKRLLTSTLQLPEKSAVAVLKLMYRVVDKHGRKLEPLWHSDEWKGDGVFRGDADTVQGTNVFAVGSGVWETELLRRHYCPSVRMQVEDIDRVVAELRQ